MTSTPPTAEDLLPLLRKKLGPSMQHVSDNNLLKFLRWKPDVEKCARRIEDHLNWRKKNPAILDETPLLASKDDALKRCLESEVIVAPDGLVAKDGSTVIIGRLRNNDMTDGRQPIDVVRMALYTMDRVLERKRTQEHGVTVFHDMIGVSTKNIHIGIPKLLFRSVIGNFPVRIRVAYILNAPLFVRGIFKIVSLFMPAKVRSLFHFIPDISMVYEIIDKDKLLEEHGGKLKHNQKEWVARHIERERDGTIESLSELVKKD